MEKGRGPEARESVIWLVSACRFAEAISIGMLIPVLPIFLEELGAPEIAFLPEPTPEQLTAILFTDMVGYPALMDEGRARQLVPRQREVLYPQVEARGGEMLREFGDGFLITFGSVTEAVRVVVR